MDNQLKDLFSKSKSNALKANVKNTFQASGNSYVLAGDDPVQGKNVIQVTTPDGAHHTLKDYSAEDLWNFIQKYLNN